MSVGRNDPCPCGSGKKHKHCCLGKPVNIGPCDGPGSDPNGRCGKPGCGAGECKLCGKRYTHCHSHHETVQMMLRGHVMRVHPESIPTDKFDELLADEEQMAGLYEQQRLAPDLWKRFFEYVEERRQGKPAVAVAEVDKIAQALRKDAKKSNYFRGADRHVDGYKVILSYATAEEMMKVHEVAENAAKGFVVTSKDVQEERLVKQEPKLQPAKPAANIVHWHFSASWRRHGEPPIDAAEMLRDLVVALGVPEDQREGTQPVIATPRVTHWFWTENIGS